MRQRPPVPRSLRPSLIRLGLRSRALVALVAALAGLAACQAGSTGIGRHVDPGAPVAAGAPPGLDVPYEPTPPEVVEAMLALGRVGPADVVYDLGCGDGRIVVAAARRGARGVGVDLDPDRIREARANARAAGVEDRVELVQGDLFAVDVSRATVVMLFLWPEVNLRLRPRLLAQLRPGARVVSHWHGMGDWKPARTVEVAGRPIHLWVVR